MTMYTILMTSVPAEIEESLVDFEMKCALVLLCTFARRTDTPGQQRGQLECFATMIWITALTASAMQCGCVQVYAYNTDGC